MSLLLTALIVCTGTAPAPVLQPVQSGTVKHYRPGLMAEVARNRTDPAHRGYVPGFRLRTDVAGYVSRPSCSTIGRVWLASIEGGPVRRYQQVDCSQPRDRPRHLSTGLILEVDYTSAVREGIVGRGRGRVVIWGWRE